MSHAETPGTGAPPPVLEMAEVRIERLAAGGDGVGHLPDGRALFVPLSAPGDRLQVRVVERHARYARGEIESVRVPGSARREPGCSAFGVCGGCAWQHIEYREQLEAKATILGDALRRIGKFELAAAPRIVASPREYRYRSRARVLVGGESVGFRRRRSHALCAVQGCPVLEEPLERALAEWKFPLPSDPPRGEQEWEVALSEDGSVRRCRTSRRGTLAEAARRAIRIPVQGHSIRVSAGVFAQANAGLREVLVSAVCAAATGTGEPARESILELFAGAGLFSLSLARRFQTLTAVESHAPAAADLRENLRAAGISNVRVVRDRVERVLSQWQGPTPQVVVLDPPRAGLGTAAATALADLGARCIAYLSCDPATLARDLGAIAARGYALSGVEGFDLFPQTPHVEALAVMHAAG